VFQERVIQITTPINPGNTGEPLVDSDDRVAGLHSTALMGAQSTSFVVLINIVKSIVTEMQPNNPARSIEVVDSQR
jgi:S1-C subfamily serine protease